MVAGIQEEAGKNRDQRQPDGPEDIVLGLDGQRGADKGYDHQGDDGAGADHLVAEPVLLQSEEITDGRYTQEVLGETHQVEGDAQGRPDEEGYADGPSHGEPQAARQDVVDAAGLYLLVGGNGGNAEPGRHGDHMGQQDDDDGVEKPGLAYHPAKAHVHDHTEYGQQRRGVNAGKGAELCCFRHQLLFVLRYKDMNSGGIRFSVRPGR